MQLVKIKGTGFGVYRRKDGRLLVKVRDPQGRPVQVTTIGSVAKANQYVRDAYRRWPGSGTADPVDWTVADMVDAYVAARVTEHRTTGKPGAGAIGSDQAGATRIRKQWPRELVGQVDRKDVKAWVAKMRKDGLSDNSIRIYLSVLRAAYKWAIEDDLISVDHPVPVFEVRKAKTGQAISEDQVRQIIAATPDRYRVFMTTLAFTGMRIGEVCALNVEDVRGRVITGGSKTDAGRDRKVAIPAWLAQVLVDHIGDRTEGPLFVNGRGDRVQAPAFRRRVWDPAAGAVGLPDATPHWLRHTMATRYAEAGASTYELRNHFGWSSRIADLYVHAASDGQTTMVDRYQTQPDLRVVS
jgi:integrase